MSNKIKIEIIAKSQYLADQSSPENHRFMWSYDVTIVNQSDEIVQVLNRYWKITDMRGKVEEVRGPGVVGLQPIIKPGKEFAYSSFAQLTTPQGTMEGFYEMQTLEDIVFQAAIPKFVLTCPSSSANVYKLHLH
jgi:ApaG protein